MPDETGDLVYRHRPEDRRERLIWRDVIPAGSRVLDIGCAATGRSATVLHELGAEITACDIDPRAVAELATQRFSDPWQLTVADMCNLPFRSETFDGAAIAFHGFDYLLTRARRRRAIADVARVLKPGGVLVLDTYNRWSAAFHFPVRPTRRLLVHRARYLAAGGPLRPTFADLDGRTLRHDTTTAVRRDIESVSDLRLEAIYDSRGVTRSWDTARFTVPEPMLTFRRGLSP